MPNWTTNKVAIHKGDLRLLVNRQGDVDFNILRRMPKSLDIGNVSIDANELAMGVYQGKAHSFPSNRTWLRQHLGYVKDGVVVSIQNPTLDDYREFGRLLCQNVEHYGHADWYSWCASDDGWGTKWNACESNVGVEDEKGYVLVVFLSAWCCPAPIIRLLRQKAKHPVRFECVDEDGYGEVHDENYNEVSLSGSLFSAVYYDEGENKLTKEEYEKAVEAGKDVWKELV